MGEEYSTGGGGGGSGGGGWDGGCSGVRMSRCPVSGVWGGGCVNVVLVKKVPGFVSCVYKKKNA